MNIFCVLLIGVSVSAAAWVSPLWAQDAQLSLEERVQALEQELAVLRRELEIEKEEKAKKAGETPVVSASAKDGFSIKSSDDNFKLKIRGIVQADARFFTDNQKDNGTTDTFSVRRARPIFEGTVSRIFDFYLMPDFGSGSAQLVDAYGEFKIDPAFKLRGGKFKPPLGLERLQSDAVSNFVEIGLPTNLVPNRDVGFQLSGDILGNSVNYAIGGFNGSADNASTTDSDNNNDKDVIGRVFALPFKNNGPECLKGLGVGMAGSYGHKEGSTLPTYKSTGQASIFSYSSTTADGEHLRLSPQAYFYKGSLGLMGEYVLSRQKVARVSGVSILREAFSNQAWQVTGNYVLTGELASYKGITPLKNFDLEKHTWGAFEVVGRFGHLDIDDDIFDNGFASLNTSVSQADAWGVGLNWYPNKNVRFSLDFEQTVFDRGAGDTEDRNTENVVLNRFQLAY